MWERQPLLIAAIYVILAYLVFRAREDRPMMAGLLSAGEWRDEALVATDPTVTAAFVILGYCRRWSVALAFFDSKQYLGLHDPRVRSERSVERAHPMAWFVGTLVVLWYCLSGHRGSHVVRERPWYKEKVTPTFTDMRARCGSRCGSTRYSANPARKCPRRNASRSC